MFRQYLICFTLVLLSLNAQASKVILVIQPGSMLGYSSALLLDELSHQLPDQLDGYFDLIGGCSTGAIIASLVRTKNAQGEPKFTAQDIAQKYLSLGRVIFSPNFDNHQRTEALENALKDALGETMINDISKDVAIFALKTKTALNRPELNKIDEEEYKLIEEFVQQQAPIQEKTLLSIELRRKAQRQLDRENYVFDRSHAVPFYKTVLASAAKGVFDSVQLTWAGEDGLNTFSDAAAEGFDTTIETLAYAHKKFPNEHFLVIDLGIKEHDQDDNYSSLIQAFLPDLQFEYFGLTPKYHGPEHDLEAQTLAVQSYLEQNQTPIKNLADKLIVSKK